jgi:hypothetical protein
MSYSFARYMYFASVIDQTCSKVVARLGDEWAHHLTQPDLRTFGMRTYNIS